MAYQALYRKWRPASFDDVRGQDHIVTTLRNQLSLDRIGHAYLFCGTRGTGKTSVAKIFAKAVNCEHPTEAGPCNECEMCRAVNEGRSMNVIEIDAASNNGVDNIRQIRDEVAFSPPQGRYKVYIIDEVHMLSTGAFNALLKTLEEPPSYGVILLLTANGEAFLPTILSRSIRLKCVQRGSGLDRMEEEDRLAVLSFLKDAWNADRTSMANAAADWKNRELRMADVGNLIRIWLRDLLILKSTGNSRLLILSSERSVLEKAAERYTYRQIQEILECLDRTERRTASNVNFELSVELLLASMRKPPKKTEIADDDWAHISLPDASELEFYNSFQEDS